MKRAVWVGVGVAGTILLLRQIAKANHALAPLAKWTSPSGVADSLTSLAVAAREVGEQVRTSMAENEAALTAALLPDDDTLAQARARRNDSRRAGDDPFAAQPNLDWPDDGSD